MAPQRCSAHVKGNDARFGLKIANCQASTGVVIGLQCRFCIAFGREEKVGSKRKPSTAVQGWNAPFRYDNIKKHLRLQHPSQWDLNSALDSIPKRDAFFDESPAAGVFKNSIKSHFASESLGAERQKVFDIEKGIVETIVGEMMFSPDDDDVSSDEDNDAMMEEHDPGFGSGAELQALLRQRGATVTTARDRALSLESEQKELQRDIALVYVTACNPIDEISIYRDHSNNPCDDPNSLPPVLPHELVKLSAANFIRKIRQHAFRLEHRYTTGQIDVIADEHKILLYAYQSEAVLKEGIDSLSSRSCFKDGWSLLGSRLPNLMEYCGVVATLFPGTSTVESDFSTL
jgi:hypothetical protein